MNARMPYLYLLALRDEVAENFHSAFDDVEGVEIIRDDFEHFMNAHPEVDGIVSPANSYGLMTGGLDKAIRDYFGMALQDAVQENILKEWFGEQTVGSCMAVEIPDFPGRKLFHTPTMRTPSVIIDYQTVYLCMRSALAAAVKAGAAYLMVPAFGGSTGRVPAEIVARNMRAAYDQILEQLERPHKENFRTAGKRTVIRGNEDTEQ